MSEKIQKVLARAGLGSRRTIETWITAGRIKVNGAIAKLGDRITAKAAVSIDGKPVKLATAKELPRVLLYHKPEGEICTRKDTEGRISVFDRLPKLHQGRWVSVGRLDITTSGLLLFTDNGELANRLMHPSSEVEREYAVRIFGEVTPAMLQRLLKGVMLEDGKSRFVSIHEVAAQGSGANRWYRVVLKEGKNRLVRRLWESQGVTVSRLMRLRYGDITLPRSLKEGHSTALNDDAVLDLLASLNMNV